MSGPAERKREKDRVHRLWPQEGHDDCEGCDFGFLAEGQSQVAVG